MAILKNTIINGTLRTNKLWISDQNIQDINVQQAKLILADESGNIIPAKFIADSKKVLSQSGTWIDLPVIPPKYSLPIATKEVLGGVSLYDATTLEKGDKIYPVQLNSLHQMLVKVPWTDTNTWLPNTKTQDGYVTKGDAHNNCGWRTDINGNPSWKSMSFLFNTEYIDKNTNKSTIHLAEVWRVRLILIGEMNSNKTEFKIKNTVLDPNSFEEDLYKRGSIIYVNFSDHKQYIRNHNNNTYEAVDSHSVLNIGDTFDIGKYYKKDIIITTESGQWYDTERLEYTIASPKNASSNISTLSNVKNCNIIKSTLNRQRINNTYIQDKEVSETNVVTNNINGNYDTHHTIQQQITDTTNTTKISMYDVSNSSFYLASAESKNGLINWNKYSSFGLTEDSTSDTWNTTLNLGNSILNKDNWFPKFNINLISKKGGHDEAHTKTANCYITADHTDPTKSILHVDKVEANNIVYLTKDKYHTTGSWSLDNITYTATANGSAGELKFNLPTAGHNHIKNHIPYIGSDGVMEAGEYIDFHTNAHTDIDYSTRIHCVNMNAPNQLELPTNNGRLTTEEWVKNILPTIDGCHGPQGPKGDPGSNGLSIGSVIGTHNTGDEVKSTYTVKLTDGTSVGTFQVQNGSKGSTGNPGNPGANGYTFTPSVATNGDLTWTKAQGSGGSVPAKVNIKGPQGPEGRGIKDVTLQSGTHAAGTTDTYKITYTKGTPTENTFTVYNGKNGADGGQGPRGPRGYDVKTVEYQSTDSNGGKVYKLKDSNGAYLDNTFTAPRGPAGPKGDTGSVADVVSDGSTGNVITGLSLGSNKKITYTKSSAAVATDRNNPINCNDAKTGIYYYNAGGPDTSIGASHTDGALFSHYYDSRRIAQVAQDYRNGNLFVRGKSNNEWQPWKEIASQNWTNSLFNPNHNLNLQTNKAISPDSHGIWGSPFVKYYWHDILAFNVNGKPKFEYSTNGNTWTEDANSELRKEPFIQKDNQSFTMISDAHPYIRWTWNPANNMSYSNAQWLVMGIPYSDKPAEVKITLKYFAEDNKWKNLTETTCTPNTDPIWIYLDRPIPILSQLELRIERTAKAAAGTHTQLSSIRLLTGRWGNQGLGPEYEYPYAWNSNCDILPRYTSNLGTNDRRWNNIYANHLNLLNGEISRVNHISFNDPGNNEGLEWLGGNGWKIYEAPDNLGNDAGNLQIVKGDTRVATFNTENNLDMANHSIKNLALNGGLFWNPYAESANDGTDMASIICYPHNPQGNSTTLEIRQANDPGDRINLSTASDDDVQINNKPIATREWVQNTAKVHNADLLDDHDSSYFVNTATQQVVQGCKTFAGAASNQPSILINQRGSWYIGLGGSADDSEVRIGPAHSSNCTWSNYNENPTQKYTFDGKVQSTNGITLNQHNSPTNITMEYDSVEECLNFIFK